MKPTRRDAALALLFPAPLLAQDAAAPANPPDDLAAVRQQTQRSAEILRSFKIPVATEPSITFRP